MVESEISLDQVSNNLITYLRSELNDAKISYDVPLTPITGGYDTLIYHFKLRGIQGELSKPLVLRLFRDFHDPDRATSESAVQNALANQGYPVPKVYFTCTNESYLGNAFLIMKFLAGENIWVAMGEEMPKILGTLHAKLHLMDPVPLLNTLKVEDVSEQCYQFNERFNKLIDKSKDFPWLQESVDWLIENRPPEPERLSICHGDFHPHNILVKDGKVTAVLDWPGFLIGDSILDVASTVVLCIIGFKHILLPTSQSAKWEEIIARYLEAYQSVRCFDLEYLDYYLVLRCVIALVNGAKGQEVWRDHAISKSLTRMVFDVTKIRILPYN
jgi:aminoglycoside phosphotransferase (APT) family kinase protein